MPSTGGHVWEVRVPNLGTQDRGNGVRFGGGSAPSISVDPRLVVWLRRAANWPLASLRSVGAPCQFDYNGS